MATWEDKVTLKQCFPRAPAWGQAVSKEGGIVSDTYGKDAQEELVQEVGQPKRLLRPPARLAGPEWQLSTTNTQPV